MTTFKAKMLAEAFPNVSAGAVEAALAQSGGHIERAGEVLASAPAQSDRRHPAAQVLTPRKQKPQGKSYSRIQSGSVIRSASAEPKKKRALAVEGSYAFVAGVQTRPPARSSPQDSHQDGACSRLQREHSWATAQVLQTLLDACGGDAGAAAHLLDDMAPRGVDGTAGTRLTERHHPIVSLYADAADIAALRSAAPSPGELPASLLERRPRRQHRARAHGSAFADADSAAGAPPHSAPSSRAQSPACGGAVPSDAAWASPAGRQDATGSSEARAGGSNADRKLASYLAQQDIYWVHRQEAVRMTHEWQKLFRRSMLAQSQGDDSTSRHLMYQAKTLRQQALEAHQQAALKIEHDTNLQRGNGAWEIDLHGLHTLEAVDALHHRLVTLHSLPLEQRKGKKLRVVTGRGNHSSGGEATVPRAVENYLLQEGWPYTKRSGAYDVAIRWGGATQSDSLVRAGDIVLGTL